MIGIGALSVPAVPAPSVLFWIDSIVFVSIVHNGNAEYDPKTDPGDIRILEIERSGRHTAKTQDHLPHKYVHKNGIQHPDQPFIKGQKFYPGKYQEKKQSKGECNEIMEKQAQQSDPIASFQRQFKPQCAPGDIIEHLAWKFSGRDRNGYKSRNDIRGAHKQSCQEYRFEKPVHFVVF
jgi:hypothetical protein